MQNTVIAPQDADNTSNQQSKSTNDVTVQQSVADKHPLLLSVFSGSGGLDLGFSQAGYKVVLADDGVPSTADQGSRLSIAIAREMLESDRQAIPRAVAQNAGKVFTDATEQFLRNAFLQLNHLRPGDWRFSTSPLVWFAGNLERRKRKRPRKDVPAAFVIQEKELTSRVASGPRKARLRVFLVFSAEEVEW